MKASHRIVVRFWRESGPEVERWYRHLSDACWAASVFAGAIHAPELACAHVYLDGRHFKDFPSVMYRRMNG